MGWGDVISFLLGVGSVFAVVGIYALIRAIVECVHLGPEGRKTMGEAYHKATNSQATKEDVRA